MQENRMRFLVGVFVLGTLFLVGVLSVLFGTFSSVLKSHSEYTIVFKEAPGLSPGTPVRKSGFRIGQVKSVELDDESGEVRILALIERPHQLRHSDMPVLVRGMFGGDPSIDFQPRKLPPDQEPDRTPLPPGAVIAGAAGTDVANLLAQTSSLVPDVQRTTDELQVAARNWSRLGERLDVLVQTNQESAVKTLENFNDAVVKVSNLFSDENQRNMAATLKNVRTDSEDFQKTLQRFNKSLDRADEVLLNIQQASKPMAERSPTIVKNLEEITEKLNRTLAETRELVKALDQGDGTVGRFLHDPAVYNNLNDVTLMLVRILPRLDRILRDAEVFADKIARHPESLGVRGAVSPGSGLKESPAAGTSWPRHP